MRKENHKPQISKKVKYPYIGAPGWLRRLSVGFLLSPDPWVLGSSSILDSLLSRESDSPSPSAPPPDCALSLKSIKPFQKRIFWNSLYFQLSFAVNLKL